MLKDSKIKTKNNHFKNICYNILNKCKEDATGIIFVIFIYILIIYFSSKINDLIFKYLTVEKGWSNNFIDSFLVGSIFFIVFYFGKNMLKKKYLYSYNQFFFLIASLIFVSIFCLEETKWEYSKLFYTSNVNIPHIIIVIIALVLFLFLGMANYLCESKSKKSILNFKEDNAIDCSSEDSDLLNYGHIAKKLKDKLVIQDFKKSFTVGIIGPWGNGKSSFINLIKKEFESEKDIITVSFLPYLNHSEADISTEFFHSFQSALTPYSGKLSNLILEYSNKLLNLYNEKDINNFLKKDIISSNSKSANDTYEIINQTLSDVNKKIIVFVDDLDRLNQDEILQVLKLIRNTANFRNTVFIVAMDKGYVLNRLSNDDTILNNRFIDKFFQLEIYLPEIDKSILIDEFKNIIENAPAFQNEQIKIKLENIINQDKILFHDHIKNLRDVKRVCNQIIFEYEFINEEIKLEDFVNFILLKLSFPEFMHKLKSNPLLYLEKFDNYYRLKKSAPDETDSEGIFNIYIENINEEEFKKYKIYNQFFGEEKNCIDDSLKLACDQKKILLKTLIALFGNVNELSHNSIKFENNFRRFMQLNYKASDFLNKNFIEIIDKTDIDEIFKSIDFIVLNEQQIELVDRIKYFTPNDNENLKTAIIIYTILLDNLEKNKLSEYEMLRNLGQFTYKNISKNSNPNIDSIEISKWFLEEIIKTDKIKIETQLKLVGHLWSVKGSDKLWYIENNTLVDLITEKFKKYLEMFDGKMWNVNDYSFYRIFHGIKLIDNIQPRLIEDFILFLNKNKIDVFCAQSTDFDSFDENIYRITDTVVEFFGSKEKFITFVKNHRDSKTLEILEFLKFLKLFNITRFSIPILFKFENFEALKTKKAYLESQNNVSVHKEVNNIQIFLNVVKEFDFNYLKSVNEFDLTNYRISDFKAYAFGDKYYLVLTRNFGSEDTHLIAYLNKIFRSLQKIYPEGLKESFNNKKIKRNDFTIEHNNEIIIKIYSVQPMQDDTYDYEIY